MDKDTEAKVLEMYSDGEKLSAIEAETGVARSAVYLVLGRHGLKPNRNRKADTRALTVDQVADKLAEAHRTIGGLQARLEAANLYIEVHERLAQEISDALQDEELDLQDLKQAMAEKMVEAGRIPISTEYGTLAGSDSQGP